MLEHRSIARFSLVVLTMAACAHGPTSRPTSAALSTGDHTVDVNGRKIAYHVAGQGPLCVVHPGGPGFQWTYLKMPELEKQLTLVYLEPVGSGASQPLAAGEFYNMRRFSDELEAFRAAVGLDRMCLIGHSHGGMVAQRYAIDHSDKLSALVLYDCFSRAGKELGEAIGPLLMGYAQKPWFKEATAALDVDAKDDATATAAWAAQLPLMFADWDAHSAEYAAVAKVPVTAAPGQAMLSPGDKPTDFRADYGKVHVPTLVVVGRHSTMTPEKFAREICDGIRGALLVTLEQSGHMGHIEEPQRFAAAVGGFVQKHAR